MDCIGVFEPAVMNSTCVGSTAVIHTTAHGIYNSFEAVDVCERKRLRFSILWYCTARLARAHPRVIKCALPANYLSRLTRSGGLRLKATVPDCNQSTRCSVGSPAGMHGSGSARNIARGSHGRILGLLNAPSRLTT
jgi:hypothetical protein